MADNVTHLIPLSKEDIVHLKILVLSRMLEVNRLKKEENANDFNLKEIKRLGHLSDVLTYKK